MTENGPQRSLHSSSTRVMSVIVMLLGLAILISTVIRSGIGLTYGVVFGVLFVAAGAGRLWVSRKGL